mgnify:CR=1 FL=1
MYNVIIFTLHPKYIIEVTKDVYDSDGILYHITPQKNLKRIQEKGFIPRNDSEFGDEYPDRVYFFTEIPPDNFRQYATDLAEYLKEGYRKRLEQAQIDFSERRISKLKYDYIVRHRYDYRDWVILKVDLKDRRSYIPNDITTTYRFFDDPRSQNGIFTYENIDPQCITGADELHIENDTDDCEEFLINKNSTQS